MQIFPCMNSSLDVSFIFFMNYVLLGFVENLSCFEKIITDKL